VSKSLYLTIPHEQLVKIIQTQARLAIENRQVAQRLDRLLPSRLAATKRGLTKGNSASTALRLALIDDDYIKHIEELAHLKGAAHHARIQYETHLMLIEARRSLRRLRLGR